jgi:hypothetical protein
MTDFASSQPYTEAEREADQAPRRSSFEIFRQRARAVANIRHYLRPATLAELRLARRIVGERE